MNDFTLTLNNSKEIKKFNNHYDLDWKITLADTGEETETGGRIVLLKKYLENEEYFMLTYGDGLSDVNINELIEFHKSHGKVGTVTGVRPAGRFGEIELNENQVIKNFNEKPQPTAGRINGGFFVFDAKKNWKYLPERSNLIFEQEPLRNMVSDNELVMYQHDGFWQPMDTYRDYKMLNDMWNEGNTPWTKK